MTSFSRLTRGLNHSIAGASLLLAWLLHSPAASGQGIPQLFALDTDDDQLVRIDPTDGVVTAVGPLGQNIFRGAQLTNYRGRLYGLIRQDRWVNSRLVEIDAVTGAIVSEVPTSDNGTNRFGESLFVWNGKLHMSVDPERDTRSQLICELALDGTLTEVSDFTGASDSDMDGVEVDPSIGRVFNLDHDGSGPTDLYDVVIDPPSQTLIRHYPSAGLGASTPALLGSTMYALSGYPQATTLYTIDVRTGDYTSLQLSSSATLRGLAFAAGLFLGVNDDEVSAGDTLGMTIRGGLFNTDAYVAITSINGSATFLTIARAPFNQDCVATLATVVPPGLAGLQLGIATFGIVKTGNVALTPTTAIDFL